MKSPFAPDNIEYITSLTLTWSISVAMIVTIFDPTGIFSLIGKLYALGLNTGSLSFILLTVTETVVVSSKLPSET